MRTGNIILLLLICLGVCLLIKYAFFLALLCIGVLMYRGIKAFNTVKKKLGREDNDTSSKYKYTEC